jgi:MotA/TolQ/ExbB proton channel family
MKTRWHFLAAGAGGALAFVAFSSVILYLLAANSADSGIAKQISSVVFDFHKSSSFPYPLTIQNLMTIVFGLGLGDLVFRHRESRSEEGIVELSFLPEDDRTVLMVRDLTPIRKKVLAAGISGSFLAGVINECILRFQATRTIDQTHSVLNTMVDFEMHKLDLKYTLLRYISWLLPTVGFIGTVVGISLTLAKMGSPGAENITQDIGALAGTLAVSFNTTMVALMQSAVLVGVMQFVQQKEEMSINRSADYCLRNLVDRLYVPENQE